MQDLPSAFLNSPGVTLKDLNLPWKEIFHLGNQRRFQAGQLLPIRDCFYYLEKGRVRLSNTASTGLQFMMSIVGENCLCGTGVLASFAQADRPSAFQCQTDVIARQFDRALLTDESFVSRYPHLMINLMQSFSVKLMHSFSVARNLAIHTPTQRLCTFIINHVGAEKGIAAPGLTHEELSTFLGVHRSTLTRILKDLREAGILGAFSRKRLQVLDMDKLTALARGVALQDIA